MRTHALLFYIFITCFLCKLLHIFVHIIQLIILYYLFSVNDKHTNQFLLYRVHIFYRHGNDNYTRIIIHLERNQSEYDPKWIYLYHCSYIQFSSSCKYSTHTTRIHSQTFLPVYSTRCINLYRAYDSVHVRFLGFAGNRIDIFRIEKSTFIFYVVPHVVAL